MGRVFKPKYAWKNKDGERVEKVTEAWYIEYADALGRWVRRKAGTTKEQAQDALRKAEADVLSEKMGLPTRGAQSIPARELLARFMQSLRAHATIGYCKRVEKDIQDILNDCRIASMKDLVPERVEGYLNNLARERNLGPTTINSRINSIKTMVSWAVRNRLIPYNPLDCIQNRKKLDIRRVRRAISENEIARLLAAAEEGPLRRYTRVFQNRPRKDGTYKPVAIEAKKQLRLAEEGANNVLVYRIMLETGLRKSETASVTWNDIDLKTGLLTTRRNWVGNKNRKEEVLPLTPGLIEALTAWRLRHPGPERAKVVKVTSRLLRYLNDDLVAAGLAKRVPLDEKKCPIPLDENGLPTKTPVSWTYDKKDAAGRAIDLHALRHTFGTRLGKNPAVDPKTIQTLMRHATPTITFKLYVHSDRDRLRNAVASLPTLGKEEVKPRTNNSATA